MKSGLHRRALRVIGSLFAAGFLAACGGGGGSGTHEAQESVQVRLATTEPITAELLSTDSMQDVTLVGSATGNLTSLNGKTIYVTIEDPAALFEPSPSVVGPYTDGRVEVYLRGRRVLASGTFTGQLIIHACLDPACVSELSGSPMRVPYNVRVLRGLELSADTINASTNFGDPATRRGVSVSLPENLTSWGARNTTPYDASLPAVVTVADTQRPLWPLEQARLR